MYVGRVLCVICCVLHKDFRLVLGLGYRSVYIHDLATYIQDLFRGSCPRSPPPSSFLPLTCHSLIILPYHLYPAFPRTKLTTAME